MINVLPLFVVGQTLKQNIGVRTDWPTDYYLIEAELGSRRGSMGLIGRPEPHS